jgi:hypothetical protein
MSWKGNKNNPVPNIGNVSSDYSQAIAQKSSNLSEKLHDVNRANQIRRDTDTQKNVTIGLVDIDTAIIKHLEKLQLTVTDEGKRIKVPTFYSNPEKWKSIQIDGYMRDYNGKLFLPAIVLKRTNSEKDPSMLLFNRYINYSVMKRYSSKNRYTPFNILIGQNVPINEVYDVLIPDHMIFTYHFIIWTEYVEQMNTLVERLNFETDDYWGDLRGLRFRTKIDSFAHTIELQVDQDRMVKTEFDLTVYGYLLPDRNYSLGGNKATTQKRFTPKKILLGMETVASDFDWNDMDSNIEKWKNQNYPNLPANTFIPTPAISIPTSTETSQTISYDVIPIGEWHLPPPTTSFDPGEPGYISYDDEYYYIYIGYVGGTWKRSPKVMVNSISSIAAQKKWTSFDNDYIYIEGSLDKIPISLFNNF